MPPARLPPARPPLIRYVYTDIVGFTKDRAAEAQADVIGHLGSAVRGALDNCSVRLRQRILLPTGDGICIALTDATLSYDIHMRVALSLVHLVRDHNVTAEDPQRRFELRVGLNQNADNIVRDVNGRRNVAGAGINVAQRVMSQGDGQQILVSQSVHDILNVREAYFDGFRRYDATVKHGAKLPVYQYTKGAEFGINGEPPLLLAPRPSTLPSRLSRFAAYYMATSIKYEDFLLTKRSDALFEIAAAVWLYFKAIDLEEESRTGRHEIFSPKIHEPAAEPSFQYAFYAKQDFWLIRKFAKCIEEHELSEYSSCFEGYATVFVSETGRRRLESDHPEIRAAVLGVP